MSSFLEFNADQSKLTVSMIVPSGWRLGYTGNNVAHLYDDGAQLSICGRVRITSMRESGVKRAGTMYLRLCAYCCFEAQMGGTRKVR